MKHTLITGILLIASLLLVGTVAADKTTNEEKFVGTWTDTNYTCTIVQEGTEITLTGIPFDEELDFPMKFTGMVSEDGTRLITNKNMTGTIEVQISEDQMEMSGIQTFDPVISSATPFTADYNSTRNGTMAHPDAIWSGEWIAGDMSMTLNQTGNAISGFFNAIFEPERKVDVEGRVSEDGRNISMNWIFVEDVNFTLSDDGMYLIDEACLGEEEKEGYYCLNMSRQA